MSETPLTDSEAAALSGTTDTDTDLIYPTNTAADYANSIFRAVHRLNTIAEAGNALRVYKDGTLTFGVRAGKYLNGDTPVNYAGASEQALTDDATNTIYLTATGTLTVNTTGFPTPSETPHVPLATILTADGTYDRDDITDYRGRAMFRVCS